MSKTKPNFQAMTRQQLMEYLEQDFDEEVLLELEKRPIPQAVVDSHEQFLKENPLPFGKQL